MPKPAPKKQAPRKPLARQRALRALAEGERPTLELLADASGLALGRLRIDARREGWRLGRVPEPDVEARLKALAAGLLDQVEAMRIAALSTGERIDRQEVDGLLAMIRGVEKIDEILRSADVARENQISNDEDLADTLDRVNERIVALAVEMAAAMVAQGAGPLGSKTG